jgi:hypothetical protein
MQHTSIMTAAAAIIAALLTAAQAQQTTFRDAGGRTIGTATRSSGGTMTLCVEC